MEELEIGDYINDINSYHLHMFDKHDVTTKKLDVIVEKAGKVDANYAAQIEGYCSLLGEYGKKFETVCAMLALDLIGVKVFRYSDETAEAVASGEKLLKESQTVYESFADMMSPDDAAKYLDFLENGSREGLTSAELAGVEKADALLVSQKVGYEDVWDLRNVGDLLESGSKGGTLAKGLIGHDFEDYLSKIIGGEGSFSVGGRDFDGGIDSRWWEAKSGNYWSMLEENPNKLTKFKSDMGDRLRIATENGATYEIFSNTPIPESIKQWLTKKGITFTELLD